MHVVLSVILVCLIFGKAQGQDGKLDNGYAFSATLPSSPEVYSFQPQPSSLAIATNSASLSSPIAEPTLPMNLNRSNNAVPLEVNSTGVNVVATTLAPTFHLGSNCSQTKEMIRQSANSPPRTSLDTAPVFSILPEGKLGVQLVAAAVAFPQASPSAVVVTAHEINYVTITMVQTSSYDGELMTRTATSSVAVATGEQETYVIFSSTPSTTAQLSEHSSSTSSSEPYSTISGFRIIPTSSSMTIQYLGTSTVTAVLANQSPAFNDGQSFVPLWVPEMLGNAYGAGWTVKPPIWIVASSVDDTRAAVQGPEATDVVVTVPSPQSIVNPQYFMLVPGTSYSFPVPMPPILEPISIAQTSPMELNSGLSPSRTPDRNLTSVYSVPPIPTAKAFGLRSSVGWTMCLISIAVSLALL